MLKVVLDTNIYVSALIKRGGKPDQILRLVERYRLFCAEAILEEVHRVLHYPRIKRKHKLKEEEIEEHILYVRSIATVYSSLPKVEVIEEDPVITSSWPARRRLGRIISSPGMSTSRTWRPTEGSRSSLRRNSSISCDKGARTPRRIGSQLPTFPIQHKGSQVAVVLHVLGLVVDCWNSGGCWCRGGPS